MERSNKDQIVDAVLVDEEGNVITDAATAAPELGGTLVAPPGGPEVIEAELVDEDFAQSAPAATPAEATPTFGMPTAGELGALRPDHLTPKSAAELAARVGVFAPPIGAATLHGANVQSPPAYQMVIDRVA